MSNTSNSKVLSLVGDALNLNSAGDFTFELLPNGKVKVKADGGHSTLLSGAEFSGIETFNLAAGSTLNVDASLLAGRDVDGAGAINITGVSFTQASDNLDVTGKGNFEPSVNLDGVISDLIAERGVKGTLETLEVNGSVGDSFKLVWDHLDDNYSYYNTAINDAFIDLGIEYAQYLLAGGAPLTGTIAKFQADGADAGATPDRSQSLHDNILGNFDELSITDKFGASGDDAIFARIQAAGLGDLLGALGNYADGRPIYGGYEGQDPAATIAFDQGFFLI